MLNPELLSALDLRVLAVQRIVAGRWWNFRHVVSPFSRLWLVMGGRATVRHHGRRFVLEPGRLHLVPPFTAHDCACRDRMDHYHLHFVARQRDGIDLFSLLDCEYEVPASRDAVARFRRIEALYPDRKLPCFDPAREEYRRHPAAAEAAARQGDVVDRFEASSLLALLVAPFLRTARVHEGMHARVTDRFLAVQQVIHSRMGEPLRLADLARAAGLHPTYFSDRFREVVGVRPLEYLTRRRLERAQDLLLSSTASVKQVAAEVGIPDAAYFTRVFSRLYQMSPTRFRDSHGT